jgi:hypothetical protein
LRRLGPVRKAFGLLAQDVYEAFAQADYYLNTIAGYIGKGIMVFDFEGDALQQGYAYCYPVPMLQRARLGPRRFHLPGGMPFDRL